MALYARLLGIDPANPKIPVHGFTAIMGEFARGRLTGAQAQAAVVDFSGAPLTPAEVTEAQTLLATITNAGAQVAQKLARSKEIEDVLMLADHRVAQYDTAAELQARLGV